MDGIQDTGEEGIPNIVVKLLDENGNPVDDPNNPGNPYEVTTDANGNYLFDDIAIGNYIVEFEIPDDYLISPKNEGSDTTVDSDIDPITMRTDVINIGFAQPTQDIDAGIFLTAKLGDHV